MDRRRENTSEGRKTYRLKTDYDEKSLKDSMRIAILKRNLDIVCAYHSSEIKEQDKAAFYRVLMVRKSQIFVFLMLLGLIVGVAHALRYRNVWNELVFVLIFQSLLSAVMWIAFAIKRKPETSSVFEYVRLYCELARRGIEVPKGELEELVGIYGIFERVPIHERLNQLNMNYNKNPFWPLYQWA